MKDSRLNFINESSCVLDRLCIPRLNNLNTKIIKNLNLRQNNRQTPTQNH